MARFRSSSYLANIYICEKCYFPLLYSLKKKTYPSFSFLFYGKVNYIRDIRLFFSFPLIILIHLFFSFESYIHTQKCVNLQVIKNKKHIYFLNDEAPKIYLLPNRVSFLLFIPLVFHERWKLYSRYLYLDALLLKIYFMWKVCVSG